MEVPIADNWVPLYQRFPLCFPSMRGVGFKFGEGVVVSAGIEINIPLYLDSRHSLPRLSDLSNFTTRSLVSRQP